MTEPPRFRKSDLPTPYEVGYGKPPTSTRFCKGKSGNPKGRPKGARNRLPAMNEERLKDIVLAEAYRGIKVNDGGRQVTIPMAEAIIRSLALNAVKGQHRSQRLFAEMLNRTEQDLKRRHDQWVLTAIDYKVDWERELERRQRLGLDLPDPIPHPNDIEIDMNTGGVNVKGPFTREEHDRWKMLADRRDSALEEVEGLRKMVTEEPDEQIRDVIEQDIVFEEHLRDRITSAIGTWPNRDGLAFRSEKRKAKKRLELSSGRKKKA